MEGVDPALCFDKACNIKQDFKINVRVPEQLQVKSVNDINLVWCGDSDINYSEVNHHTLKGEKGKTVLVGFKNEGELGFKKGYTNPEFTAVGKTEEQLKTEGIAYEVKNISMSFSGRFVAENEMVNGVCKILYNNEQEILGFHILGNPASGFIVVAGMAIEKNMKIGDLREMVFPHPTVAEIIRESLY